MSDEDISDDEHPSCEMGTCNEKPFVTCAACGFGVCEKEHHLSVMIQCKHPGCGEYVCSKERPISEDEDGFDPAECLPAHEKTSHRRAPKRKAVAASAAAGKDDAAASVHPPSQKKKKAFEPFPFRYNAAKANKVEDGSCPLTGIISDGCGDMPSAWQDVIKTAIAQLFRLSPDTKLSIQKDAIRERRPWEKVDDEGLGATVFRFKDMPNKDARRVVSLISTDDKRLFLSATTHPLQQKFNSRDDYPLVDLFKSIGDVNLGAVSDEILAKTINEHAQRLVAFFNKTNEKIPEACNKVYHVLVHSTSFVLFPEVPNEAIPVYTMHTVDTGKQLPREEKRDSVVCAVVKELSIMIESALKLMYLTGSDVFTKDTHKQLFDGAHDFIVKNTRHLADPLSPELSLRRVLQFFTLVPCIDVKRLGFHPLDLYRFVVQVIAPEMQDYKGAKSTKPIKVFPFGRIRRFFGDHKSGFPPWLFGSPLVSVEQYEPPELPAHQPEPGPSDDDVPDEDDGDDDDEEEES